MFEQYNLDELYLAAIDVIYSKDHEFEEDLGGLLLIGTSGYGYWTILRKTEEGNFIDLQYPKILIATDHDSSKTSYTISYMEPLSNYYEVSATHKRKTFSRRQAMKEARQHYDVINAKWKASQNN